MKRRAVLLAAILLACATPARSPLEAASARAGSASASGRELALAGFQAWIRNDAASASARMAEAIRRDPKDPLARLGAAWVARRALDEDGEVTELLALVAGEPASDLAPVAARRLGQLADVAPALARRVADDLEPLVTRGTLRGMAAYRARFAIATAAESLGQSERAAQFRREAGTATAWTLAGPCGAYHALDIDRAFPPEEGPLPARFPGAPGLPLVEPRPMPAPDGIVTLEGEPPGGDIYYLASRIDLARGGRYLLSVGGTATHVAWLDGKAVAERRPYAGYPPYAVVIPLDLPAGRHRLMVKIGRGAAAASVLVALARDDGAPCDGAWSAIDAGEGGAVGRRERPRAPLGGARALVDALEPEVGPVLARLVAARDVADTDRETAKRLVEEALPLAPEAALLHALRADLSRGDPTLADKVAAARAESEYELALGRDAGDAATRTKLAELMRESERLDDAQTVLASLGAGDAGRPPTLVLRARIASARGFAQRAERLAEEARRQDGDCQATELLYELASQRDAVAREDELAQALSVCRGGRTRLAQHRHARGDLGGEMTLLGSLVREDPARIELRLAYARALVAGGSPAAAAAQLAELARFWPREPRIAKRSADVLELAGDPAGARAARERALRLDGGDLALRRALALADGTEVLAARAEDAKQAIASYEASRKKVDTSVAGVLDATAIEVQPDGSVVERVHEIVHVLDQRGVDEHGEISIPAGADVLAARALKKDGRTLEPMEGARGHALTVPGLEPGDYVEWEYLRAVPARGASLPGFATVPFYFRAAGFPLWRSSLVVVAPKGSGLEVDAHHLARPDVQAEGDREVVRATANDVPALVEEPGAPSPAEILPFVQVGAGAGREAMHLAFADMLVERARPSEEVRRLAREIESEVTKDRRSPSDALLRAAYARVNEIVLGPGGGWSEPASAILSRGRGNRAILLKAVYAALGVKARFAIVRGFTSDPAAYRFPHPELYGDLVVRVERAGEAVWLDPATRFTPYGVLPDRLRGCEALVLPEPGEATEVTRTPEADPADEGREVEARIAIAEDGAGVVEVVERYRGYDAASAKAMLERLDAQARRQVVEQALSRSFGGLAMESLEIDGERLGDGPVVLRYRMRVPQLARVQPGGAILDAPFQPLSLGARFLSRGARETPLLVTSMDRSVVRVTIVAPPGLKPAPADDREVASEFGRYLRRERIEGGALVREDRFVLGRARIAPGTYPSFARFATAVDDAQAAPVTFTK